MCSWRPSAAVGVSAPRLHREAIQTLVMSVFPSASIAFAHGPVAEDNTLNGLVHKLSHRRQPHCGASLPLSDSLRAVRGPFAECCTPTAVRVWSRLYELWPPSLVGGRPLWRSDEETGTESLPCWTPHAVVYIGGYEATDLRRVVAPQLFAQVPPFSGDDAVKQTVGGVPFDYDRRKVPKFAARVLKESVLLKEKGCAIHEPDLVEIAIPVVLTPDERNGEESSSSSLSRRVQTFISFASPETTVHMLQRAVEPIQRAALRPAFGFSQSALRYALPPPVLTATRLLRRWNAMWSPNPLSAAFWLSTIGHAVDQLPPEEVDSFLAQLKLTNHKIRDDATEKADINGVALQLAVAAASGVNSHVEECYSNYFLRAESFEEERYVRELRKYAGHLPVQELRDVVEGIGSVH